VVTEGDLVRSLEEKSEKPESDLINAGIYLLSPEIFEISGQVTCSSRGEYELTDALAILIAGKRLQSYLLTSWIDVGYPWDLLWANERLLSSAGTKNEGIIEDGVWIHGDVSVGKGSIIKSGTYIEGPCCIGKNSRVGPHAYIRGSTSIGDECHIGHSTEIKNSIIMNGTKIPHFNYVGDSIIGSGCNFGAGTKVANLRHDHAPVRVCGKNSRRKKMGAIVGDGVQLGINCSVNVGAVIGNNVTAAPHSVIDGCISPDTRIR
jgi:UDP-N-acetylglucosamine diphosphorylase/glucosamine-1-phosphate N-acetyltransferase